MNIAGFTTHTLVPGIFLADKSEFKQLFQFESPLVREYGFHKNRHQ